MGRAGYGWAGAAGTCAAFAAVFAKAASISSQIDWRLQLLGYVGVILLNVAMWSCYVNSLKALTSLQATVINFSTNFLVSGLTGFFFFKESLHLQWFAGAFLIVLGTFILSKSSILPELVSQAAKSKVN
ncbi:hypothetical protein SUGI_0253020 [Cryptomeria japonica]|nr:hypothetical protein SUGI_0253020 [Cryptomeria japonica]